MIVFSRKKEGFLKAGIHLNAKKAIKIISYCSDVLQPGHLLTTPSIPGIGSFYLLGRLEQKGEW